MTPWLYIFVSLASNDVAKCVIRSNAATNSRAPVFFQRCTYLLVYLPRKLTNQCTEYHQLSPKSLLLHCVCVVAFVGTQVHVVAELAKEYSFQDVDGGRPPSIRSLRFLLPTYLFPKVLPKGVEVTTDSVPDWLLPMEIMRGGKPPS